MLRRITPAAATVTGSIVSGSAVVTGLTSSSLEGALRVSGSGLPLGTLVKSFDSPSQITLTQDATDTNASASLTFTLEPITLAEAKNQGRIEIPDDDSLIADFIATARDLFENELSRSFLDTDWRLTLPWFPCDTGYHYNSLPGIKIPRADLSSVTSITYIDPLGVMQALAPSAYSVEVGAPGWIWPVYGTTWPATQSFPGSVTIDFVAGYGPTAAYVPEAIRTAMRLMVAHLYENREATVTSSIGLREAPLGVQRLLASGDWGGGYA